MTHEMTVGCVEFRDLITDYLEEALSPAMAQGVERHRQTCRGCEEFLGQVGLTIEALGSLNRQKSADTLPPRLLSAFREWKESAAEDLVLAEKTIDALLELADDGLKLAVLGISIRNLRLLGQIAIDEAVRMGVVEPKKAVKLAEVGVAIFARASDLEGVDLAHANERLAESWAVLGNAKRIYSDLRGAGEAFRQSDRYLEGNTNNSVYRASVLQLKAVYLAECGELAEAVRSIDEAILIYQSIGDSHLVGKALIGKGTLIRPFGDPAISVENLQTGLELIDTSREPRLELVAKHNLVNSLIENGSRRQALNVLAEVREHHHQLNNPVDLIRFRWLEGSIALDLEEMGKAEQILLQVKKYFVENEIAMDAALVSMELAMVYLKQARIVELKELAGEMVTIFSGLGVQRELFAAMAFFNKAKEIEQSAAMGLLQELVEILDKARQRVANQPQPGVSN